MLMNKEMQGDYKIERREKRESVERNRCPCCNIWCCTQVRAAEQRVQECSETTIERSGFAPLLLTNQKEASPAFETQKEDWLAPRNSFLLQTTDWNHRHVESVQQRSCRCLGANELKPQQRMFGANLVMHERKIEGDP